MTLAWPALALVLLSSADQDSTDVATLVADLGAPRYADRQRATESLLALGADARPLLEQALAARDPEVRHRAEWLIDTIDGMTLVRPSTVQFEPGERPLVDYLAALGKQSGCMLTIEANQGEISRLAQRRVPWKSGEATTFWGAIDQLRAAVGRPIMLEDRTTRRDGQAFASVVLERGRPIAVTHAGPVRAEVGDFIRHRDQAMSLPIRLRVEPRLRVRVTALPSELEAIDEFGHALVGQLDPLRDPTEAGFADSDQNGGVSITFPMTRPAGMGKTLKHLKFAVPVALAVRRSEPLATLPYPDLDNKPQTLGDLTVMGRKQGLFAGAGQAITLMIRGNLEPSPDLCDDQLDLLDAKGQSMVSSNGGNMMMWGGFGGMGRGGRLGRNWISRVYQCPSDDDAGAAELRYYELKQTGTVLRFEFKDLTLPE